MLHAKRLAAGMFAVALVLMATAGVMLGGWLIMHVLVLIIQYGVMWYAAAFVAIALCYMLGTFLVKSASPMTFDDDDDNGDDENRDSPLENRSALHGGDAPEESRPEVWVSIDPMIDSADDHEDAPRNWLPPTSQER